MHETHTEITADGGKHAPARDPERPAVGALTVRTERRADVLVLWLSGALDKATSAVLDREFDAHAGHAAHVVFDLTGLELIDSSGLETLVRSHHRATENHQWTSFRQGPHAGRLPPELTHDAPRHFQPAARRANTSASENFAHVTQCADVDHQRPLVIDPEAPWKRASGQAAGASDEPPHSVARAAPRPPFSSRVPRMMHGSSSPGSPLRSPRADSYDGDGACPG